ncbi:sodium:solute symporter [Serratia marcescens]|uniref:Sodium:solute symporter n=1 Tax=Serratia marcescens TaxID=615 RepID=A0ABD6HRT8_SERMA|nr:sodium:solute symporter [Serratia marcescens]MVF05183.1 sodium:solute symporter [Serratia marcescens]
MKKVFELVMFTLFFSSLPEFGLAAGFFSLLGTAELIGRFIW